MAATQKSTPRLLRTLFSTPDRGLQAIASLVLGLLGLIFFAVVSTVFFSALVHTTVDVQPELRNSVICCAAVTYFFLVLFTNQLIASTQLPVSVRTALVYAVNFLCWQIMLYDLHVVEGLLVFVFSALCTAGFVQQLRGWRVLAWSQTKRTNNKISIATMMDITATIAITLGLFQIGPINTSEISAAAAVSLVFGLFGWHTWGRITKLCTNQMDESTGQALWHVGNFVLSGVLLLIILTRNEYKLASFLLLIGVLLGIYGWTAIAVYWLKACGWTCVSPNDINHEGSNDTAT